VVSFLRTCFAVLMLFSASFVAVSAQAVPPSNGEKPTATPKPTPSPKPTATPKGQSANFTAEQIVESTIVVYAYPGGRPVLDQIRKTTFERGKTSFVNGDGKTETANYQKWIIRGPSLGKEKLRLDQEMSNKVSYSLVQNNEKVVLMVNDSVYAPREDASRTFQNQIFRGLDGFLRYKENESTLALAGKEKILGVEYYLIDITDKQARKTRYYVSVKRFRVMMLEYEEGGRKFKRKFYNYNYAQGTLVPFRTVLYDGDKVIEDTEIGTITFGQKVDEALFPPES